MSCGCRCQAIIRVATKSDLPDTCSPGLCEGQLAIAASDLSVLYILVNDPAATLACGRGWQPFEVGPASSRDVLLFATATDLNNGGNPLTGYLSNATNTLLAPASQPQEYPYFPALGGGTLVRLTTNITDGNPAGGTTFTVYVNGAPTAMATTYIAGETGVKDYLTPIVVPSGQRTISVQIATAGTSSGETFRCSAALEVLRDVGIPAA